MAKGDVIGEIREGEHDLAGTRFGILTALYPKEGDEVHSSWMCRCDCGKYVVVPYGTLTSLNIVSCGCRTGIRKRDVPPERANVLGRSCGMLHPVRPSGEDMDEWICNCECGRVCRVSTADFLGRRVVSCGCLQASVTDERVREDIKYCQHNPIRQSWYSMRDRCRPDYRDHDSYYDAGIRVCDDWSDYDAFWKWAYDNGWMPGRLMVRRDLSKGYSPDNCYWGTHSDLGMVAHHKVHNA